MNSHATRKQVLIGALFATMTLAVMVSNPVAADSTAAPQRTPPSLLTRDNFERIKARKDEITETEVLKILGQPTSIYKTSPANGDYTMSWQHRTYIQIKTKRGRVHSITGGFSPHVPSKRINLETFKKIKLGTTEDDVRKMLGAPDAAGSTKDGEEFVWEDVIAITVTFKDEIAVGLLMITPVAE